MGLLDSIAEKLGYEKIETEIEAEEPDRLYDVVIDLPDKQYSGVMGKTEMLEVMSGWVHGSERVRFLMFVGGKETIMLVKLTDIKSMIGVLLEKDKSNEPGATVS